MREHIRKYGTPIKRQPWYQSFCGAKQFGVARSVVYQIVKRTSYKMVTENLV